MSVAGPIAIPTDLAVALASAERLVVLTGAGISKESGLPTFRDPGDGLWAQHDPQEICTPEAFERDPCLVWNWHEDQRKLALQARPNPGHLALAEIERHVPRVVVVTQNFDGLHQQAGSTRVAELHGSVLRLKCSAEGVLVDRGDARPGTPPKCPRCGALLRHDVVWFGEALPQEPWVEALEETAACDVFLSVGTSGVVQPAASLPDLAYSIGATVAFMNLDVETSADPPVFAVHGRAGEVLPELVRVTWVTGGAAGAAT